MFVSLSTVASDWFPTASRGPGGIKHMIEQPANGCYMCWLLHLKFSRSVQN